MKKNKHTVSPLKKTWIFDLDGTIVKHNGHITDGKDVLLDGAYEFLRKIPETDMIIFLTSRSSNLKEKTETFLFENKIRFNEIIWDLPFGERILINDMKPSGLCTAIAINTERDVFMNDIFEIDDSL